MSKYLTKLYQEVAKLRTHIAKLEADLSDRQAEIDKWRNWRPSDDDLAEMQRQARGRDGTYQKSLAANSVYIGGLEVRIRQLEALSAARQAEVERLRAEVEWLRAKYADLGE